MGVHVNNDHANKRRQDCRYTCGDLITLGLRDQVGIMTGDWNQSGNYLEECCYHAVRNHERRNNMEPGTIAWLIPGTVCEIRSIFSTGQSVAFLITWLSRRCPRSRTLPLK